MRILISFISGILFSVGLLISGMANPQKVLNFLIINKNFPHSWDSSLVFVMIGAIIVSSIMYFMIKKSFFTNTLTDNFQIPNSQIINAPLIIGAGLFGIGWGISGICPGPAVVLLALTPVKSLYFFVPMLISMGIMKKLKN